MKHSSATMLNDIHPFLRLMEGGTDQAHIRLTTLPLNCRPQPVAARVSSRDVRPVCCTGGLDAPPRGSLLCTRNTGSDFR
jgi:hypothetical protein